VDRRTVGRRGRPPRKPAPVPRKVPKRSPATRDGIVAAAEHVLATAGTAGLSTNRIAIRAGVSIGSVYQYFPNKEAIVATIIDRYSEQIFGIVADAFRDRADAPLPDLLADVGDRVVAAWRSHAPIHRHLRELDAMAGATARLATTLDRIVDLVAAYLATRTIAAPPRVLAFTLVHAVAGAINAFAERREDDPEPMVRVLIGMIVSAVGSRGPASFT
jgi:AcrR family transcriptional regulator